MPDFKIFDTFSSIRVGSISVATILSAVVILMICFAVMAIIKKLSLRALEKSNLDGAVKGFIRSALSVILWFITIIIVADSLGIPVNSLVAVLGVAGLALSLSVQNLLSNLFSGITILATKPFSSGEFVELGGVSGIVREVGILTTKLTTTDNRIIFVPNSDIMASKITNYSREPVRRVDQRFPVKHNLLPSDIKNALLGVMRADSRILSDPAPFAALESFENGAQVYLIRAWTKNEHYWDVYFGLNESICLALSELGAPIVGKQLDVNLKNDQE